MAFEFKSESFLPELHAPAPLEQILRDRFDGASWSAIRKLIATGKVHVDAQAVSEARQPVLPGATIAIRMTAPRLKPGLQTGTDQVLFCDPHVLVVKKPIGIASVEHEDEPTSLQQQLHEWLGRKERRPQPPLKVVHRLDKVTSGVMLFARTQNAQLALKEQFRAHTTGRFYLAVAHGTVDDATLSYRLVRNRGDGLRGTTDDPNLGRHSVTHVEAQEQLARCTLVQCRLETGRTHQIRIHLAEIGHPVVGDPVYGRGYRGPVLDSSRTLLHAAFLSFAHPVHRKRLEFEDPLPLEFEEFLARERRVPKARVSSRSRE
jgi:23S rRNA pseudouridine1911/1915/1917 synthase